MRLPVGLVAIPAALLVLSACGSAPDPEAAPAPTVPSSPSSVSPSVTSSPSRSSGPAGATPALGSTSCPEIRAGIDAFNVGDFATTVADFEKAIPLAEAEDDGSHAAALLVAAVKYYASLAPDAYPVAAQSSPAFEKYKQVTLGLCETGAPTASSSAPGVSI